MKGFTLSVLVILFSMALGASSGIAIGSFVAPNGAPALEQNSESNEVKSSPTSSGDGSGKTTNAIPSPSILDDNGALPANSPSSVQPVAPPTTRSVFGSSSASVDNNTPIVTNQTRVSALSNGSVVQVSNQVASALLAGACGDSNADGEFDIGDVVIGLQLSVGLLQPTRFYEVFGDLNSDGELNIIDAIAALNIMISDNPNPTQCGPFVDQ